MAILARLIYVAFTAFAIGLAIYCLLGMVRIPPLDNFRKFLGRIYGPILAPLRRMFRPVRVIGMDIDYSPWVLLLVILLLRNVLVYVVTGTW